MATDAEKYERGSIVINYGIEAARAVAKMGLDGPKSMRFLSDGIVDDATTGNGPAAVLDLLSLALLRLAEKENADA